MPLAKAGTYRSLWYARYGASDNCKLNLPAMEGWGGNLVVLMPNGMTGIRLSKNWDGSEDVDDYSGMAKVAESPGPALQVTS